jgi:hypothetical protein
MATRTVSEEWLRAVDSLWGSATEQRTADTTRTPGPLYHFTDCAGLIGILQNRTLWASLTTCLNDPSEVEYGIEYAQALVRDSKISAEHFPLERIDNRVRQWATHSRVYTVSFCQNLNLAGQWLHYGKAGSGVAVGFYANRLTSGRSTTGKTPFGLYEVLYSEVQQTDAIHTIVSTIDASLSSLFPTLHNDVEKQELREVAADLAATNIWMVAPRLKHPSFKAEEEWRLIAYEPRGPGAPRDGTAGLQLPPATGETRYRSSAGRVVPYKTISFDPLPVFEVVLGRSCPMQEKDLGILVLMEDTLGVRLSVRMSDVPVRA